MKKFLFMLAVFGALASFADDSYIYWMIGDTTGYTGYTDVKILAFNDAGSEYLLPLGWNNEGTFTEITTGWNDAALQSRQSNNMGLYASLSNVSGASGYSYVIELFNDQGKFMAQSDVTTYAALAEMGALSGGDLKGMMSAWKPAAYAVPEPNSALLMVLGCAALALRRRKMIKG